MLISCTHCQTGLDVTPEHIGQTVQCPACNGKLQVTAPAEGSINPAGKPKREGWVEEDHANAHFLKSLLIGIGATVVFLLAMFPFKGTRLGDIFLDRGWVNYAETFLFFWGVGILVLKFIKNKRQEKASLIHLFPAHLGAEVNSSTVAGFIDNIYKVPAALRDSIIVNRIRKALELFETRNSNNETAAFLSTQSDLDANRSEGSYSLIKVFLWAIPILGFIGTVMGLSQAVGSLAMGDGSNPEELQSAITGLTSGLGTAFDTTLLGLILSIFLSFPLAAVQKGEDATLTFIDAYCTEKLLPQLNDSRASSNDDILEQADSLPELVGSLARAHETFLTNLNESTLLIKESTELMRAQMASGQSEMTTAFTEAADRLSKTSSQIFMKSDNELEVVFKRLASGVDLINGSLKKLGESQIPNDKKKGWFGR